MLYKSANQDLYFTQNKLKGRWELSKFSETQIEFLTDSLQEMEYGSIVITVHDGQITQIDKTEKKRFLKTKRPHQPARSQK